MLTYLLTGPFSNIIGVYQIVPRIAASEMGWDTESQMVPVLRRLCDAELVEFDPESSFVWVRIWWDHNSASMSVGGTLRQRTFEQIADIPPQWREPFVSDFLARLPAHGSKKHGDLRASVENQLAVESSLLNRESTSHPYSSDTVSVPASYPTESTSPGLAMRAGFQATVGTATGGPPLKDRVSIPYQYPIDRACVNTTFNDNSISNTTTGLRFPASLTTDERAFAAKCLAPFGTADAQDLLDELAAKLCAGKVQSNPLSYLAGLARKASAGEFVPTARSTRAQMESGHCVPSAEPMDSRNHTTMMRQAIAKGVLKNATSGSR
ncbi:hypothetical protein [Burkholderia pseudomallei]|uniref:hypothetical protein n=1 Tax=Burkholderia pseudomallei TaxID=28450 RepID=UPI00100C0294|nr:hypothetical protein [Burkholderia pseudomallei]